MAFFAVCVKPRILDLGQSPFPALRLPYGRAVKICEPGKLEIRQQQIAQAAMKSLVSRRWQLGLERAETVRLLRWKSRSYE
jgi:hypothetical protein